MFKQELVRRALKLANETARAMPTRALPHVIVAGDFNLREVPMRGALEGLPRDWTGTTYVVGRDRDFILSSTKLNETAGELPPALDKVHRAMGASTDYGAHIPQVKARPRDPLATSCHLLPSLRLAETPLAWSLLLAFLPPAAMRGKAAATFQSNCVNWPRRLASASAIARPTSSSRLNLQRQTATGFVCSGACVSQQLALLQASVLARPSLQPLQPLQRLAARSSLQPLRPQTARCVCSRCRQTSWSILQPLRRRVLFHRNAWIWWTA